MVEKSNKQETTVRQLRKRIAELEKACDSLRKSEEKYHSIFSNSRDGIVVVDAKTGDIIECNKEFERICGRTLDSLRKMKIWEIRPKDQIEKAKKKFFEIKESGTGGSTELSIQKPDGEIINIDFLAVRQKIGGHEYIHSTVRDNTERKAMEEKLKESEKKYRSFIENTQEGVWALDANAITTFVNPRMAQMLGYTINEMMGKHLFSFMDDEGVKIATRNLKRRRAGIKEQHDFIFLSKDGKPVYTRLQTSPLKDDDGNYTGALAFVTDITQQKQVEHTLRLNQFSIENAGHPVLWIKPDGHIVYANNYTCKELGYSKKEIESLLIHDIDIGITRREWASRWKTLRTEGSGSVETTYKTKSGRTFPVLVTACHLEFEGEEYNFACVHDITKQKELEKELKDLYQKEKQLRHEVENEMYYRLDFTRALVHELKTPLTPMLASSEALLNLIDDENLISWADMLHSGASRLNKRINDLLDLAKGDIGTLKIHREPVDTTDMILNISREMKPQLDRKEQTLAIQLSKTLPPINADKERLHQVITNLLTNASKYTPRNGRILIRSRQNGKQALFEVEDNGIGIDEEDVKKLFKPYYQFSNASTKSAGLGLGLSISKMLVNLHGGKIGYKRHRGKGSIFYFTIPTE